MNHDKPKAQAEERNRARTTRRQTPPRRVLVRFAPAVRFQVPVAQPITSTMRPYANNPFSAPATAAANDGFHAIAGPATKDAQRTSSPGGRPLSFPTNKGGGIL
jgi:hypothetical protein